MYNQSLAPIILFVYNRPIHTEITLKALANNDWSLDSDLYIFCDGPKFNSTQKLLDEINLTRNVVRQANNIGFKTVTIIESDTNKGLANSIIEGVSWVIKKYKSAIILEDDIVPSIGFLKYMNQALEMYQNDNSVGCIHAWNYPLNSSNIKDETFFIYGADCWGWATWERAWEKFEKNGLVLLDELKNQNKTSIFNRKNTHKFVNMLEDQINGKNNSWAIRWHASLVIHNMFCLQPVKALVKNIGFDGSGEHCDVNELIATNLQTDYILLNKIPIQDSKWFYKEYKKYKFTLFFKRVLQKIVNLR